jgi:hypothetical protein
MKLMGFTALSVEIKTNSETPFFIAARAIFHAAYGD